MTGWNTTKTNARKNQTFKKKHKLGGLNTHERLNNDQSMNQSISDYGY